MPATLQIKPLLIGILDSVLNSYLGLDARSPDLLTPIAGKVIAIHIMPFEETIYLRPGFKKIEVLADNPGAGVDAMLSGSLAALGLMGVSARPMRALFKGEVRITGDTEAARGLQNLFAKLNIDLQGKLAKYTGDPFAQRLTTLVRGSLDWGRGSFSALQRNLLEFLQEETRDLPAKPEAELFFQKVDDCRSDYDRLSVRVERLNAALNNSQSRNTP
ncbi:MAG: SCP2 sterol-binding domain-containing protein [Methylomonas sp.]|jgi:ubiquinone biosynthesis protein UbiJ